LPRCSADPSKALPKPMGIDRLEKIIHRPRLKSPYGMLGMRRHENHRDTIGRECIKQVETFFAAA
jgi:hypothetical protein